MTVTQAEHSSTQDKAHTGRTASGPIAKSSHSDTAQESYGILPSYKDIANYAFMKHLTYAEKHAWPRHVAHVCNPSALED